MADLPDRVLHQRLRLQIQSLDSPSELPGAPPRAVRRSLEMGVSPMTHLAGALQTSSLAEGAPPSLGTPSPAVPDCQRRLLLDQLSSSSGSDAAHSPEGLDHSMDSNVSPAPMGPLVRSDSTPLSSITNRPARTKLGFSTDRLTSLKALSRDLSPGNKENVVPTAHPALFSPDKRGKQLMKSPCLGELGSPGQAAEEAARRAKSVGGLARRRSVKRPVFPAEGLEDTDSLDSGYGSQSLPEAKRRRSQEAVGESMEEMLAGCSPGKEGLAALPESPEAKEVDEVMEGEGFSVCVLGTVPEEQEEGEGPRRLNSMSFLDNKMLLPSRPLPAPAAGQRPTFRRALSMLDTLEAGRPAAPHFGKLGFKRPPPPGVPADLGKKRRLCHEPAGEATAPVARPVLGRSMSAQDMSIMRSCQVKEDTPDVLPDSSRLYCLPSSASHQHPSLRAITCDTLATAMEGGFGSRIRSLRVIDVRYGFEFEGGHIKSAENWQHGEDEQFLNAFLPPSKQPLSSVPPPYDAERSSQGESGRDILVFHCEFSSQRGPDFYKKLRERDRTLNQSVYPGLYFPEIYLLHKGYKEFWQTYPHLCEGSYTEMNDPQHSQDLRRMRAKSKSWSGGTVSRTGRLSRLHI